MKRVVVALCALAAVSSLPAFAKDGPANCLSKQTGVSEKVVDACVRASMPAKKPSADKAGGPPEAGSKAGKDHEKQMAQALLPCLQKDKPDLKAKKLKSALTACRPDSPPVQH